MTAWTPERVDEFAALLADGLPFRECGRLLRVGESSAIGKAWRLRAAGDQRFFRDRHSPLDRPRKRRKRKAPAAAPKPPTPPRAPSSRAKAPPLRIVWADPRQLNLRLDPCGKRLGDLEASECHYLIGSMDYCARPVPTGSAKAYCECHHKLMYRPAPRAA